MHLRASAHPNPGSCRHLIPHFCSLNPNPKQNVFTPKIAFLPVMSWRRRSATDVSSRSERRRLQNKKQQKEPFCDVHAVFSETLILISRRGNPLLLGSVGDGGESDEETTCHDSKASFQLKQVLKLQRQMQVMGSVTDGASSPSR